MARYELTEEQTGLLVESVNLTWPQRLEPEWRAVANGAFAALNAPAESCGECEEHKRCLAALDKLYGTLKRENDSALRFCGDLRQQLATAKAECERLESALAETRSHERALNDTCDVQQVGIDELKQQLAEARAEVKDLKATMEVLSDPEMVEKIREGLGDIAVGRVQDAEEVFAELEADDTSEGCPKCRGSGESACSQSEGHGPGCDVCHGVGEVSKDVHGLWIELHEVRKELSAARAEREGELAPLECQEDDMPVIDHETAVIGAIASALSGVDVLAKKRILRYFAHRNGLLYYDSPVRVGTRVESSDAR